MKKVFLLMFCFLTAGLLFGQASKEITFELQGIIPPVLTLSTDLSDVEVVDLVNAESAYLGKIVVYTNTKGLWTIVVKSKNSGKLMGQTPGNEDVYPYYLHFGTVDKIDLSNEFFLTYNTLVPKTTVEYPIRVSYERLEDLDDPVVSDVYSDIVTIQVTIT
jgi:hypothetical protein